MVGLKIRINSGLVSCVYVLIYVMSFTFSLPFSFLTCTIILKLSFQICFSSSRFQSVQFSRSVVSDSLWPHGLQCTRPPCPSSSPGVYSDSCPSSRWCHPAISSSVIPFSSCSQSFPASESFPVSQLFTSGGQSIGSFSFSISSSNEYSGLVSLGWTVWTSLQSRGLLRVFSNPTVQKHQFFGTQLFSRFIGTQLLFVLCFLFDRLFRVGDVSASTKSCTQRPPLVFSPGESWWNFPNWAFSAFVIWIIITIYKIFF